MTVTSPAARAGRARPATLYLPRVALTRPTPRRAAQLALGVIWLIDAALQYQPYMFTKDFVTQQLAPTAGGNPWVIAQPITWAAHVMVHHIAVYNALFASIQLLLALGLFWRPTVKVALALSILWAIAVWWLGEGLGGVLAGGVDPFMGSPGAVILYAFIAVLVWPSPPRETDRHAEVSPAASGPLGPTLPRLGWLALWGSFAYQTVQPAVRSPSSLGVMVTEMGSGEPGWIQHMDTTLGRALAGHGTEVSIASALLFAFIAIAVCIPPLTRLAVIIAAVGGLAILVAENFGEIFTGHGTDPNSGLLLVLLAALFWPLKEGRSGPACPRSAAEDAVGPAPTRFAP